MDDQFLYHLHRDPPPEFAARLRTRLEQHGAHARRGAAGWPLSRIATLAAAVGLVAALFAFPSVRASAQAFLDLFRVINFVAVPVGDDRVKQLTSAQLDLERMIGEQVEVLVQPGPPQPFLTPEAAGSAAGIRVSVPGSIPTSVVQTGVEVQGERAARVTGNTAKLRRVLDSLAITDVRIPNGLDGQTVTVKVPPRVIIKYQRGDGKIFFIQARTPEITLPGGLDLPVLGEIGLRVLGLDQAEAHRFAQAIDWHTTLLVPVPANATSFRQVQVGSNRGLFVETSTPPATPQGRPQRESMVFWSEGDRVYAMRGPLSPTDLLMMASSVR